MSVGRRTPRELQVAVVVLAAGTSTRWGARAPKQLADWRGEPLVRRAARVARESAASEVVVVVGHEADRVEQALDGLDVRTVRNPDYASGQASSVRAGIAALSADVDGALFLPCDQPLLEVATLDQLIENFAELGPERGRHAVVPEHRGRRGSPALIGASLLPRLAELDGDEGGRRVLAEVPDRVVAVEIPSCAPLRDVDTLAELCELAEQARASSAPMTDVSMTDEVRRLPALLPLEGVVRHYAWGSRTFLATLRSPPGRAPEPSDEPEAELWLGAHPTAPSRVRVRSRELPLDELIAQRPAEILGTRPTGERPELPFLLKILAAEEPLSVQLHPGAAWARAGWQREEAAGAGRDAPHRLYPDPNAKPEVACALTPFQALQGLRPPSEARALIASFCGPEGAALLERADPDEPGALLEAILELDEAAGRALSAAAARAARRANGPEADWVERLAETHPGDPLVVAPLLMSLVTLAPGEALYTPPGVIHSYLDGAVVELMRSSDNVLRAGLTRKHVDPAALLAALEREPTETRALTPRPIGGGPWQEYPGTGALRLLVVDVGPAAPVAVESWNEPSILLAIAGEVLARSDDGDTEEEGKTEEDAVTLHPGDAALLPAGASCRLEGAGRLYRAGAASD